MPSREQSSPDQAAAIGSYSPVDDAFVRSAPSLPVMRCTSRSGIISRRLADASVPGGSASNW